MSGPTVMMGHVSFYRDNECTGDQEWGELGAFKQQPGTDTANVATRTVAAWSRARNTEYEGDYYDVPVPTTSEFKFANGQVGSISTVSFVPANPSKWECNSPAIRFTAAAVASNDQTYGLLMISYIGAPESLTEEQEREILSRYQPPA